MAKIIGLPKLSPTMEEGTLARWAKKEGDSIAIDDLIAEIETDKATMEWRAFDPGVLLKILAEEGAVLVPDAPRAARARAAPAAPAAPAAASATGGRALASPLVRKLAREHDVDLTEVAGSGPKGRVIKRDLDAWLASPRAAAPAASAAPWGERLPPRVEKLSSMRRTIARRLTESKQTVPHFYLTIDLDAAPLLEIGRAHV